MARNAPQYRVYTLCPREHDSDFWLNIGVGWNHHDGKGVTLSLQALPLGNKLVLRDYEEPPKTEGDTDPTQEGVGNPQSKAGATTPTQQKRQSAKTG